MTTGKSKFSALTDSLKTFDEAPEKPEPSAPAKQKAVNTARHNAAKPAKQKATAPDSKPVNVTIRVPEEMRIWWTVQSTLERMTLTDVIIEELTERYGEPQEIKPHKGKGK